jgi:hypothetical protein
MEIIAIFLITLAFDNMILATVKMFYPKRINNKMLEFFRGITLILVTIAVVILMLK